MPELPEAETIARGLRGRVGGERIGAVEVRHADVLRQSRQELASRVRGRAVSAVSRRGKNVVLELAGGGVIAVNLGMTGRLLPFPSPPRGQERPTHTAVCFRFHSGGILAFDDVRRFGTVEALTSAEWQERSARMGPEPLERGFTPAKLHESLRVSRSPLRSWLLDQRRLAGVGNIYAAEALHHAGLHPRLPANRVSREEAERLHRAVRDVLRAAISKGGTTIRDYRDADGRRGSFAARLLVYGRAGEPCVRCGATVQRVVFSSRSAFFCPVCQPAPAAY